MLTPSTWRTRFDRLHDMSGIARRTGGRIADFLKYEDEEDWAWEEERPELRRPGYEQVRTRLRRTVNPPGPRRTPTEPGRSTIQSRSAIQKGSKSPCPCG